MLGALLNKKWKIMELTCIPTKSQDAYVLTKTYQDQYLKIILASWEWKISIFPTSGGVLDEVADSPSVM